MSYRYVATYLPSAFTSSLLSGNACCLYQTYICLRRYPKAVTPRQWAASRVRRAVGNLHRLWVTCIEFGLIRGSLTSVCNIGLWLRQLDRATRITEHCHMGRESKQQSVLALWRPVPAAATGGSACAGSFSPSNHPELDAGSPAQRSWDANTQGDILCALQPCESCCATSIRERH